MQSFEDGLRAAIEAKPKLSARDRRILEILNGPDSKRKRKRLARMENYARAEAGIDPNTGAIDWSEVNWAKLLENIIAILSKLLPLILA